MPQQLKRAEQLRFAHGAAENMPFAEGAFNCLYSVEAAQHFRDLDAFAREAARVLRPGGRAVIASFLVPDAAPARPERLTELLDTYSTGLDVAHTIPQLTGSLERAGLTGVRATAIGASVWPGWTAGWRACGSPAPGLATSADLP
ncbi:class I SAM-dependent methyltransferase [Streptomyces lydicus]|uniref:class I SAM-dependent methyltransferase n=1 Tax=Streptomyces lydicus TaxID=47763 RepID=UPI00378FDF4F